jgi:hypothetical protein
VHGILVPEVRAPRCKQQLVYRYEPSSSTLITRSPLLRDPYEHRYVYVKDSSLPMAGEGLYAKTKIKKAIITSFPYHKRDSLTRLGGAANGFIG